MLPANLSIDLLSRRHKRDNFDFGIDTLDRYTKKQANRDSKGAYSTYRHYFEIVAKTAPVLS